MYTVLLAVDREAEPARHTAAAVGNLPGDHTDVNVFVLHCFTENPEGASATQLASVRAAVDELEEAGIANEVVETSGDPAEEIQDRAEELEADLVVVGGRKRSPAGKALFGSVSQSVILQSDRPVMVTGAEANERR